MKKKIVEFLMQLFAIIAIPIFGSRVGREPAEMHAERVVIYSHWKVVVSKNDLFFNLQNDFVYFSSQLNRRKSRHFFHRNKPSGISNNTILNNSSMSLPCRLPSYSNVVDRLTSLLPNETSPITVRLVLYSNLQTLPNTTFCSDQFLFIIESPR